MPLYWTSEAIADRETIYDYIEADNPLAALALDELFTEQAELLLAHPALGRPGRVAATREWVVHQHYVLVYDIVSADVRILRVLHTQLRWPGAGR